jgi:CRP-like cAMP-binding protein
VNPELALASSPKARSVRDIVLSLRSQPLLAGLDDDGLLLLAEHGHSTLYRDGDVISVEGEPSRSVHLVKSGTIAVSRRGELLATSSAGEGYGALPFLARAPSMLAVAVGETRTLELSAAVFESALVENFSLLRGTLRRLGAGVLSMRGNLPADPEHPPAVDEGTYYDEPRKLVQVLLHLRQREFGRMNLDALVDMVRRMIDVRYAAGDVLWAVGDVSTHALHIDAGRVRCTGADGRSVVVGRGFTLGVLDVWSRERVYEARAETPVIAFRTEFERFLSLLETHPEVGLDLLRGFARDLLALTLAPRLDTR